MSHEWLFTNSEGGPIRLYSWRTNVWVPSLTKARIKDSKNPDKVLLEKRPRIHLVPAFSPTPLAAARVGSRYIRRLTGWRIIRIR
jgi:hypothetical protein